MQFDAICYADAICNGIDDGDDAICNEDDDKFAEEFWLEIERKAAELEVTVDYFMMEFM